ncbi:NAD(P)-dependent oxidoreductase [Pseudogracilibacillus sp. SE30717A]|uniref:NAD(P)-dependent oxidoreductase n=1 Tax=Pseudogracilibacillus sp. SE30717A TaxID=3098293 RepID=UPI00300E4C53
MKNIGVVGCGLMGFGIASTLLKKNYHVSVFDINDEAVNNLVKIGAKRAESVRTLAKDVEVMILSLPSPSLINHLMTDKEQGAFHVMKKGSFILDMSTNDVEMTRKLNESAKTYGIEYFDCPLSGGPDGANEGTLTIMVGGNEKAFHNVLPVLEAVGSNITYIGESGAGQIVKLCHNMVVGGIISLLSETLEVGEKAGVPKEKIASVFQKGSAQTKVMDVFGSNIVADTCENVKFSLGNMMKDMNLYRNLAESQKVPAISSQSAYQLFQIASYNGKRQKDSSAVYEIVKALGEGELKN